MRGVIYKLKIYSLALSRKKLGEPIKEAKGKYFESSIDLRNWLVVLFERTTLRVAFFQVLLLWGDLYV